MLIVLVTVTAHVTLMVMVMVMVMVMGMVMVTIMDMAYVSRIPQWYLYVSPMPMVWLITAGTVTLGVKVRIRKC